jgi:hypothetical protein
MVLAAAVTPTPYPRLSHCPYLMEFAMRHFVFIRLHLWLLASPAAIPLSSAIKFQVPKGTRILLAPWAVNRSSELWVPDANAFCWYHQLGSVYTVKWTVCMLLSKSRLIHVDRCRCVPGPVQTEIPLNPIRRYSVVSTPVPQLSAESPSTAM